MTSMLGADLCTLVDSGVPAILATINPDGAPQTSVVWVGRDGDDLLISTQRGRRKEMNLRREPRASLSVYDPADSDRYAEVRGTVTITDDVDRALAFALAERYEGPGAGKEYLDLPADVVRVVLRLSPSRVLGSLA